MIIYELRAPQPECYYMLGLFAGLDELRQALTKHDGGPDTGGAMVEGAEDEELLEVWAHELNAFNSDGCGGEHVATIKRHQEYHEGEDAYYWASEWSIPSSTASPTSCSR